MDLSIDLFKEGELQKEEVSAQYAIFLCVYLVIRHFISIFCRIICDVKRAVFVAQRRNALCIFTKEKIGQTSVGTHSFRHAAELVLKRKKRKMTRKFGYAEIST